MTLRKCTNNRPHFKWRLIQPLVCGCSFSNRDCPHSPVQAPAHRTGGSCRKNAVTEQGVVLGFVSCIPSWESRMHQAQLLCQRGSLLALSNMAGTFPVPLGEGRWLLCTSGEGVGGTEVKADGNTEQLQSCAYKYTPTAVGWWAVETELCLCLLLLPTNKPLVEPCVPARRVHGFQGSAAPWYVPAGSWQR